MASFFLKEGNVPATSEKERGRVKFENSEGLNSCSVRFLWDVYFLFVLTLFHYPFLFYCILTFNYSFLNEIIASTISLVLLKSEYQIQLCCYNHHINNSTIILTINSLA